MTLIRLVVPGRLVCLDSANVEIGDLVAVVLKPT